MTGFCVSKVQSKRGVLIGSLAVEEGGSESPGFDSISFGGSVSGGNTRELPGRGMMSVRGVVEMLSSQPSGMKGRHKGE